MTQADLATAAKVSVGLVTRAEAVDGLPMLTRRDSTALQTALEAAGVEFVQGKGVGAGVSLRMDKCCSPDPASLLAYPPSRPLKSASLMTSLAVGRCRVV